MVGQRPYIPHIGNASGSPDVKRQECVGVSTVCFTSVSEASVLAGKAPLSSYLGNPKPQVELPVLRHIASLLSPFSDKIQCLIPFSFSIPTGVQLKRDRRKGELAAEEIETHIYYTNICQEFGIIFNAVINVER